MLKSYTAAFFQRVTGLKRGGIVKDAADQARILRTCKNVRAKDYLFSFDLAANASQREAVNTTANWHFLLCGVSAWFGDDGAALSQDNWPVVSVTLENFYPSTTFTSDDINRVPPVLVFGRECAHDANGTPRHYEEQRNIFMDLGQRFSIMLDAKAGAVPCRGGVLLTGIEINETEFLNGGK